MPDESATFLESDSPQSTSIARTPVNVLVMNLPFRVRWQDLKDLCRQACPIERADVALEIDGRSRGFGEVTCANPADAEKLFKMLDGYEWQTRRLSVIVMEEQIQNASGLQNTSSSSGTFASGNQARLQGFRAPMTTLQPSIPSDDKLLFVGNLPFSMQWQDLKDLLRAAGRVQRTDISMSSDGRSRGWGTALFLTPEEAQNAVNMFNDTEVDGRRIKVRLDRLGGRGVPGHTPYQKFRSEGPTMPVQQQYPASFPLQQRYGQSETTPNYGSNLYASYQQQGASQAFSTTPADIYGGDFLEASHHSSSKQQQQSRQLEKRSRDRNWGI